jgi:hypothetical protein
MIGDSGSLEGGEEAPLKGWGRTPTFVASVYRKHAQVPAAATALTCMPTYCATLLRRWMTEVRVRIGGMRVICAVKDAI